MTASSLRLSSQPFSSPGGTTSASWRLPRLRHLPASPNESLTTISVRPASFRPATRLEPMKPAPPVTNNIAHPRQLLAPLCPSAFARATSLPKKRKMAPHRPGAPRTPQRHYGHTGQALNGKLPGLRAHLPRCDTKGGSPPYVLTNESKFVYFFPS